MECNEGENNFCALSLARVDFHVDRKITRTLSLEKNCHFQLTFSSSESLWSSVFLFLFFFRLPFFLSIVIVMPSFISAFSASWKQIKFIIRKNLWKYNKMRQNVDVLVLQWLIIITCSSCHLCYSTSCDHFSAMRRFNYLKTAKPWKSYRTWLK